MKTIILYTILVMVLAIPVMADNGMVHVLSAHGVNETAERLENILMQKGMTIFNRIKHSESAAKVGIALRDTQLIIFGNPKVGSPLMQCQQSVAIDLPQKALVWEDDQEKVRISYNHPKYLQQRHRIAGCESVFSKIEKALAGMSRSAAAR